MASGSPHALWPLNFARFVPIPTSTVWARLPRPTVTSTHRPTAGSVETIFYAKNAQSALKLGHARGVTLVCAARAGVQVFEYTAGQIKQAATGKGRAEKAQVQTMVRLILGLSTPLGLDTSDALAAAICHHQWVDHPALEARL